MEEIERHLSFVANYSSIKIVLAKYWLTTESQERKNMVKLNQVKLNQSQLDLPEFNNRTQSDLTVAYVSKAAVQIFVIKRQRFRFCRHLSSKIPATV